MFSLSKTILFRGIWTRHLMDNSLGKKIMFEFGTNILTTPHHFERPEE
jgi:hypothetical protein